MKKKAGLALLLALCAIVGLSALDRSLTPFVEAGSGQASGDFFSARGDWYSELGRSSFTDTGSYSPYFPILLGGVGADLALFNGDSWWTRNKKALIFGVELGAWGGAIKAEDAAGDDFASTRARSLVLSFHADERFRFPIGESSFASFSFGPIIGFNCRYYVQDYISGIYGKASLSPSLAEVLFLGFGLGGDYGFRLGRGNLVLAVRGDLGLTRLASGEGVLGDSITLPRRFLGRVGYEFPLGASRKGDD